MRINHRSDFDFYIRLFDSDGKPVGLPRDIELDMRLITGWLDELDGEEWCPKLAGFRQGAYSAKYRKDVTENCIVEGGKLRIIVDNHNLTPGALTIEMTLKLPRTIYPDGDQRIVAKKKTCIELITGRGDAWTDSPTIDFYLPVSLPQTDKATVMTQPLPFRFADFDRAVTTVDDICFDRFREYDFFFRKGADGGCEAIDPAEGPYNIYAADGRIIANTDRLFICGHTVYRHTGRELVNVAIEQNPNQRLVSRTPSINAHPGLVYLDRGFIRLPVGREGAEVRVSLKDMYLQWFDGCGYPSQADGLIPLMKLSRHFRHVSEPVADGDTLTYTVERDDPYMRLALHADQTPGPLDPPITVLPLSEGGDAAAPSGKAVKPAGTGSIGGILRPPVTVIPEPSVDDEGCWPGNRRKSGYIGVRCDSQGRTIFYRVKKAFGAREVMPPSCADVTEALDRRYPRNGNRPMPLRGETWGSFRIGMLSRKEHHRQERLQIEVWKRKRLRWRRDKEGRPVARWKWRRVSLDTRIGARNCLIRARKLVGTACSPWAYFNVALMDRGRIYPAAQVRL